ncbi:CAAX prenyl protease [Parahypoxylon ruwenzoriense]
MPLIPSFVTRYFSREQPKPPPISTRTAVLFLVIYTFIYVVPFYLSPKTRPSRSLSRDAPSVIRARVASVSLTCVICSLITFVILTSQQGGRATTAEALRALGYWPVGLVETGKCLLLTAVLFAGPLFETLVVDGGWRGWLALRLVSRISSEWTTWRNIVIGPFTEEVLFRSASVPLMLTAQTSVLTTIFVSPLVFGLAHLHHFYEVRVSHPHVPAGVVALRCLFQLAYTSLFGAYATFLFLRSGSLLAVFVVHAFCNCMGLPRVWGRVYPIRNGGYGEQAPEEASVLWTVSYYVLLVAGAVGWWRSLGVLTQSSNALMAIEM